MFVFKGFNRKIDLAATFSSVFVGYYLFVLTFHLVGHFYTFLTRLMIHYEYDFFKSGLNHVFSVIMLFKSPIVSVLIIAGFANFYMRVLSICIAKKIGKSKLGGVKLSFDLGGAKRLWTSKK